MQSGQDTLPRYQRLTVGVVVATVVLNIIAYVSEQAYALWQYSDPISWAQFFSPATIAATLDGLGSHCLLMALMAWCVVRHWQEKKGLGTRLSWRLLWGFTGIYTVVLALESVALIVWYEPVYLSVFVYFREYLFLLPTAQIQLLLMGASALLTNMMSAVLVAAVLVSLLCLGKAKDNNPAPTLAPSANVNRAVAVLCGLFMAALVWQFATLSDYFFFDLRQAHPWLLISTVMTPLVTFLLTFFGVYKGVGQPHSIAPWRTLAVAVVALLVTLSVCVLFAVVTGIVLVLWGTSSQLMASQIAPLMMLFGLCWCGLSVLLPYWFAGIFYHRLQTQTANH